MNAADFNLMISKAAIGQTIKFNRKTVVLVSEGEQFREIRVGRETGYLLLGDFPCLTHGLKTEFLKTI